MASSINKISSNIPAPQAQSTTFVKKLPVDIQKTCLSFLDTRDISRVNRVCTDLTAIKSREIHLNLSGSKIDDAELGRIIAKYKVIGSKIVSIDLSACDNIRNASLVHLAGLTTLTHLSLAHIMITTKGIAHLGNFTALTHLNLSGNCMVEDAGMAHLANLTALAHLDLSRNWRVTDGVVAYLGALTRLTHLNLYNTQISDKGIAHLANLTALTHLDISVNWGLTDAGLAHLGALTGLTYLNLEYAGITDKGMTHLCNLTELTYLNLMNTIISDEGIACLTNLTQLRDLNVNDKFTTHSLPFLRLLAVRNQFHSRIRVLGESALRSTKKDTVQKICSLIENFAQPVQPQENTDHDSEDEAESIPFSMFSKCVIS
jgi:Leucine-rich repeat (LRR) protein